VTDAAELRYRYEERAAICEFDGKIDRARAEARAWHEVAPIWYRESGTHVAGNICAGCARPLASGADAVPLPNGERAHAGNNYACIHAYAKRWKGAAAAALAAIGIPAPRQGEGRAA
jgi:hypothetical protein